MNRRLETVSFRDCVYSQDSLYFFSSENFLPMRKNLITGETKFLPLNTKGETMKRAIDLEITIGRSLYALDIAGRYLMRYDMDTYEMTFYEIDCQHSADGNFAYMGVLDNRIYIFTREAGKIVVFDTSKEIAESIVYPNTENSMYLCGCKMGKSFFVFPKDGNQVLEYVADESKWSVHRLRENLNGCIHAVKDEEQIYILLTNGAVFQWNIKRNKLNKIDYDLQIFTEQNTASRICCTRDYMIILPSLAQDIIKIRRDNAKAAIYKDYPSDFLYDSDKKHYSKYFGYCENATEYYFACRTSGYILKIDKQSGEISWLKSEVDIKDTIRTYLKEGNAFREKEGYLEYFITLPNQARIKEETSDIGKYIWKEMKGK